LGAHEHSHQQYAEQSSKESRGTALVRTRHGCSLDRQCLATAGLDQAACQSTVAAQGKRRPWRTGQPAGKSLA
jgi:hypothetical protein